MLINCGLFVKINKLTAGDFAKLAAFVDGCIARYKMESGFREVEKHTDDYRKACETDPAVARFLEDRDGNV